MAIPEAPAHRRASRTATKVAFLAIGIALLAAIGVAMLRPSWIASALKGRIEQIATKSVGLPVTIGAIDAKFLPKPGATLKDFRVGGSADEPALVEANSASATAQLWPLIRSLGKEVRVDELVLEQATVNLVRREDGRWNYEDMKSEPSEPSEREVFISSVALKGGEVRIVDHQAKGGTATVALEQIDLTVENVGPGQTMEVEGAASLASRQQNVTAALEVESPLGKPEGYFPKVEGEVEMKGVRVGAFKLFLPPNAADLFTGGSANGKVTVKTTDDRHYAVNGAWTIDRLRLRGEPAQGAMQFSSTIDPANAAGSKIAISQISVKGPGVDLGGSATVQLEPMSTEFAVKGPLLDLGELLSAMPPEPEEEDEVGKKDLLPQQLREQLGAMTIHGSLEIHEVRRGKLSARSLNARGRLDDGVFMLESATAQLFGGVADLSGTRIDLRPNQPEWSLRAKVKSLDVGQAFGMLSGHQAVAGKAHVDLTVDGAGTDWATVRQALSGDGTLQLLDGALTSVDLAEKIAPALAAGLRQLGKEGAAGTLERAGRGTELKDLKTGFTLRDGFMNLSRPIAFRSTAGAFELGGKIGLDQRLDLDGKVTASPEFVARASRGMLRSAVPLPLAVDGTLLHPDVKPGSAGGLLKNLGRNPPEPVRREIDKVKESAKDRAKQGIEGALDRFRRRP